MFYYLNTVSQIKRIASNINLLENNLNLNTDDEILKDITGGLLYKNLLESEIGESLKKSEAFTFTINTDGISLSENSTLSMWPVYLVINEIKPEERFCFENVIIAGTIFFAS